MMSLASTLLQDVLHCAAHSTSTFAVTICCSPVVSTLVLVFHVKRFWSCETSAYNSFLAVQLSVLCMSHSLEFCLLDDQIDVIYQ